MCNNVGGKVKKHSRNEFNFEATTARVQNLSYFDQHVVTWQCSLNVLETINAFATGNYHYYLFFCKHILICDVYFQSVVLTVFKKIILLFILII